MSTITLNRPVTFKRTQAGEWVVVGSPATVLADSYVTVTKRDGSLKSVYVERVGRIFERDGEALVYGYIGTEPAGPRHKTEYVWGRPVCDGCGEIIEHPRQHCWEIGGFCQP